MGNGVLSRGVNLTIQLYLLPRIKMGMEVYIHPLSAFSWCGQGKLYRFIFCIALLIYSDLNERKLIQGGVFSSVLSSPRTFPPVLTFAAIRPQVERTITCRAIQVTSPRPAGKSEELPC